MTSAWRLQTINKPIVECLGSAGGGVYVAEEKIPEGPLAGREGIFIPLKFSGRALLSAQENLHTEENDPSFSSGVSTLSMPRGRRAGD